MGLERQNLVFINSHFREKLCKELDKNLSLPEFKCLLKALEKFWKFDIQHNILHNISRNQSYTADSTSQTQ